MPADVLTRLREQDGIVTVSYFSGYILPAAAKTMSESIDLERELKKKYNDPKRVEEELKRWMAQHPYPRCTIHDLLDHIDHIARVAGVERVAIGSDFDGVRTPPTQLDHVSCYAYITLGLLYRSYTEERIRGILGGNLMRVLRGAVAYAAKRRKAAAP
jgi:membrane dipeptidase